MYLKPRSYQAHAGQSPKQNSIWNLGPHSYNFEVIYLKVTFQNLSVVINIDISLFFILAPFSICENTNALSVQFDNH